MLNIHNSYNYNTKAPKISFGGQKFVVRKAQSHLEKLKINLKSDIAMNEFFYATQQPHLPNWVRKISKFIDNIACAITQPIIDIRKHDVIGVFNSENKILGGVYGVKKLGFYEITGLFLDKSLRGTKHSPQILKDILGEIKKIAQQRKIPCIHCQTYKTALARIRLYKKAGFKEFKPIHSLDSPLVVNLVAKTEDLNLNI